MPEKPLFSYLSGKSDKSIKFINRQVKSFSQNEERLKALEEEEADAVEVAAQEDEEKEAGNEVKKNVVLPHHNI